MELNFLLCQKHFQIGKLHKVPKIFEKQIQLTENGLKRAKSKSWTFYRCKRTKIFNKSYSHEINFIQILHLFKNHKSPYRPHKSENLKINSKNFTNLTYYFSWILHTTSYIYYILAAQNIFSYHMPEFSKYW